MRLRTQFPCATLGFGCWGIGGSTPEIPSYGPTDDQRSLYALEMALQRGITFFDTAPAYGHSEALLGEAFAGSLAPIFIASKAGRERFDLEPDFAIDSMTRVLEQTLKRLRRDHLDLLQLHSPPESLLAKPDEYLKWFQDLMRQGIIHHYGVSVKTPSQGILTMERLQPSALQVNFNLMDQRVIDCGLLVSALEHGVAMIIRTPLCFGFLTGTIDHTTQFFPGDHRMEWSWKQRQQWIDGGRSFAILGRAAGMSVTELALRYLLSFAPVAVVIPGMMSAEEVMANATIMEKGPLDQPMLEEIRHLYEMHNRFAPI